ncbi:hypothetical protein [Microbacterium sp. H83]|uniref:hypothetical protein n=1 Tax=Microbacterium sp. H83 TaxID=1827324 RepID=UPI0007F3E653|nr:hypothetical protein [Microbacterium sp. H83]OAN41166.1 hypothetical protein A4X16_11685 [Microbacterium sp. H83]
MFEHPYLAYKVTAFDEEQLQRAVELRRVVAEHPDQIVPRPAGPVRRLLRRMLHHGARSASAAASASVDRRPNPAREPAAAR